MSAASIRRIERGDLPPLLAIYNHYVVHTPVTFDIAPRTLAQREAWFECFAEPGPHQCFVALQSGVPIGWACSTPLKEKEAYDSSVETSIYLAPDLQRQGLGRQLYGALFDALRGEDIHRVYAAITQPNEASNALHRRFGFTLIGTQSEVGRKFGRFWDVALYERRFAVTGYTLPFTACG